MSKLNAPRETPYDFRVFESEGIVWLFDNSSRTYICSQTPNIWAEPLYWSDGECDEMLPEADYFSVSRGDTLPWDTCGVGNRHEPSGIWDESVSEKEAWDDAREEANANHRI